MNLDVLIIAAHPDDAELSMGGTIAKLINNGFKVGIIDLTKGEMGTRGSVETRKLESEEANKILGITYRQNLNLADGDVKFNREKLVKVVEVIRYHKPKLVFGPYKNDRHPDHIGAHQLVKEAMFFTGAVKFETIFQGNVQENYRPERVFYYMQTYEFEPSFVVDISDTFETKMKAVRAYSSQFFNPDSNEPETFISAPRFIKYLEARAVSYGFQIGKDYGEPFFSEEKIELKLETLL